MSHRIAWLLWGDEPIGGVRRALGNFAAGLAERGWQVSMICLDEGSLAEALRNCGYQVRCLDTQGHHHSAYAASVAGSFGRLRGQLQLRGYRERLRAVLMELQPGSLSLYWPDFLPLAGPLCRSLGIPLLWEMPEVPSVQRFRVNQRVYRALLGLWRVKPIANSRFTAGRLGQVPGLSVVYPPSDPRRFDPKTSQPLVTQRIRAAPGCLPGRLGGEAVAAEMRSSIDRGRASAGRSPVASGVRRRPSGLFLRQVTATAGGDACAAGESSFSASAG